MSEQSLLTIEGEVDNPQRLTFAELAAIDPADQIVDVSKFDPKRQGDAVTLSALMALAKVRPAARFIGLHATTDDFHASIPLAPVKNTAFLIYRLAGQPLNLKAGGPYRFYIPNHAECHTDDIDECANVKFVDRIEFTAIKGFDNRPEDDEQHAQLHQQQDQQQ